MVAALPDALLSQFSDWIAARLGLSFPRTRWRDLERAIQSTARELRFADGESCLRWLLSAALTEQQLAIVASHLTVGETYFFRDKRVFDVLERHILRALIRCRRCTERRLRIWSAGCSTGEEAYSLAILLSRMIPARQDWHITILATDINPHALRKAALGIYSDWSFRDGPPGLREKYFKRTKDGRFEIAPQLKALVTFASLNLADDVYPAAKTNTQAMDIVVCRNVLMYVEPQQAQAMIERLCRALVEGGWLLVSPVETALVARPEMVAVRFGDTTLYQKNTSLGPPRRATDGTACRLPARSGVSLALSATCEAYSLPQAERRHPLPLAGMGRRPTTPEPAQSGAAVRHVPGREAAVAEVALAPLSRRPDDGERLALLARAYANQGQLGEAARWCHRAIAADKLNPAWLRLLASILQEQGHTEEAIAALQRALYLDHNDALAHFALGHLCRRQGRQWESSRHFRNALAILRGYQPDQVLPESAGITAGQLIEIIGATLAQEGSA
jgi:chemotaxis protein methyltransferase CheR